MKKEKTIIFILFLFLMGITTYGAQYILISWYYDEKVSITEQTTFVNIGFISISSDKRFQFYVTPKVIPVDEKEPVQIQVNSIRIGSVNISMSPFSPTRVTRKSISGTLGLGFIFYQPPNDFMVILTFTFMPL